MFDCVIRAFALVQVLHLYTCQCVHAKSVFVQPLFDFGPMAWFCLRSGFFVLQEERTDGQTAGHAQGMHE